MASARPTASIVVHATSEAALVDASLERVLAQRFRDFEVLVLDAGAAHATLDVVRGYPAARLIELPPAPPTAGGALNRAFAAARGDLLVALGPHVVPLGEAWLGRLVSHFVDPRVAGVWGGQAAWPHCPPAPEVFEQHLGAYLEDVHRGFSTLNGAVRRSAWETHRFREDLPAGEDKEWAYWALRQGLVLVYDGGAAVWRARRDSLLATWRRAHRAHARYAALIEVRPFGLADLPRRAWSALRAHAEQSATPAEALRRVWAEWPAFLMTQLGRYTGERYARRRREHAPTTEPTSTRRPS